ncbi:MAG: hypothetical protein ACFFC6_17335 [Promethearchaeota archaeon]
MSFLTNVYTKDIIVIVFFLILPFVVFLLPLLALTTNTLVGFLYGAISFFGLLIGKKWKLLLIYSILLIVFFFSVLFLPQQFWETLIIMTGREVPEEWNWTYLIWTPFDTYKIVIMLLFPFLILFFSIVIYFLTGTLLLRKNYHSIVTRLFFCSFVSMGIAHLVYFYWFFSTSSISILSALIPDLVSPWLEIIFYGFIFIAMVTNTLASYYLVGKQVKAYSKMFYFISGFSFSISSFLLITKGEPHSDYSLIDILLPPTGYSPVLVFFYIVSLLCPIIYSLYYLTYSPEWITSKRQEWIKRTRLGILLLIPFVIGKALSFLPGVDPYTGLVLFIMPIFCHYLSILVIYSGLPELSEWFFDEIKLRSSPELIQLKPNVSLVKLWEFIDEWQQTRAIQESEMTNDMLETYIHEVTKYIHDWSEPTG